ncbi:prepilin-type N-terminal cleavage/methylation domain-containing protein [Dehalobacter sp. DCM]|uniref:type II secretion system protein n=1 Tax=Dehalobacter sp. DCM TaxID=2907827 RepID=UPI0030815F57|nr:prepilin-type N-terminal cleavage/methylation domain-containing protein [Dehalobacter sp. DCM]
MKNRNRGFTLLEVMVVVVILAILAAVVIPRLVGSTDTAREKADITTGREVKSALDRYQVEKGIYPKTSEVTAASGTITCTGLIPTYVKKLDMSVTQQTAETGTGFGVGTIIDETYSQPTNLIMLYLTADGSDAEVIVYKSDLTTALWSSI